MRIDRAFAARLIDAAVSRGADLAEVYLRSSRKLSVEVREQKVDAVKSSVDFGCSLRVIKDGRLGFSYSTDKDDAGTTVLANALESAQWVERDDYLDLPSHQDDPAVRIYDSSLVSPDREIALTKALAIEKAALDFDARITKVRKASASFSDTDLLIMNSKGLEKSCSATACSGQITLVAEEGGESQMGWESDGSRFLRDVSFEETGRNAARRALQLLGAKKMDRTRAHVILDNSVAVEFLEVFGSLLSSEAVQKGKSLLANRMNEEIISPLVSIADDGLMDGKLGSRPFDDEGVPVSGRHLILNGVLRGYMYNTYTSKKDRVKSTGNAVRGGFKTLPSVGPLNLSLGVRDSSVHPELSVLVEKGLYVTDVMGMHTVNPVSGDFSIGVSGLWIEKGKVNHAVKGAMISGNLLEFFKKVEAAGDDVRFYGNMSSPSLLIGETDISA